MHILTSSAGCGTQILLYANSTDGLKWDKPNLGLFDVAEVRPDLAKFGKENNIIMKGSANLACSQTRALCRSILLQS